MRDGRVGEHPLEIPLHDRGEVPPGERDARDDRDCDRPEILLARKRGDQDAEGEHQSDRLRRGRHERRDRRRRALVDVWRPHVERRRRRLEGEPRKHHRKPGEHEAVVGEPLLPDRARNCPELQLTRRAVDEHRAEEQDGRAEAADDEVLEARFQGAHDVDLDRTEDVEADREPLQPEEQRHQVVRLHQERHAAARRGQQRVVLAHVAAARPLAVRDADGEEARTGDDDLCESAVAVAHDRARDLERRVGALGVEECGGDTGSGESRSRNAGRKRPPCTRRNEDRRQQADAPDPEQDQRGRKGEPVDRRFRHQNERCSVIPAGQTDSATRSPRSGTTTASSAGRRSSASSDTAAPTFSCSTAEIRRSMYIAASTIPLAPTTAQPQPALKIPARIRNSPANAVEPGTASAMTPKAISTVARAGRPRAIPPSRAKSPVAARRSIAPATRKSAAERSPWFTICRTAPERPRSFIAKSPIVIRLICARLEYAITPRTSGARNATREPYTRPTAASARIKGRRSCAGSGNFAIAMARNP